MSKTHYPTHDNRYLADRRVVAGAIPPLTAMCITGVSCRSYVGLLLVLIAVMEKGG